MLFWIYFHNLLLVLRVYLSMSQYPKALYPDPYVWIPNSFTPNSDNDNDTWFPIVKNISFLEVRIFNRWGEEIFFSNDVNSTWNGYYSNQLCQNGVYVYLVNWKTIEGRSYAKTGHIVLIR